MNIYLLEPYYTGSHKAWADGYARASRHRVTRLTMPGYFWKWRMHGGAVTLTESLREAAASHPPHLLLISDMLDATTLLALTRDLTARVPVVFYFHENQLTYPPVPGSKRDLHYGWINYASSLVSEHVLFNSRYHLEVWYDELPRLLKHFPDFVPLETIAGLRQRSSVLPPGVSLERLRAPVESELPPRGHAGTPPLILWNHRWEFDKNPQDFFALLDRIAAAGLPFRLALAGESFRNLPEEFLAAGERFREQLVHFGRATREQYRALLQRSDIIISTAQHEFFGIATIEAIGAGAMPLLPQRLSYPELIPPSWHARVLYSSLDDAFERLAAWLRDGVPEHTLLQASVERYDWRQLAPRYDTLFERLVAAR